MIKFYKGNPILIKRYKGRNSFKVKITIYYRYSLFKVEKYEHTLTLSDNRTINDVMVAIKETIDNLDKIVKLK